MTLDAEILMKLKKRKILVADDERFSRSIVVRALTGAEVEQAADGAQALHCLIREPDAYALAICDFNMPVMDGLRFLKGVRSGMDGITPSLPVIMLTGNSDSGLVKAALMLDVDAFVVKPVAVTPLHARILHVMTQHQDLKSPLHYAQVNIEDISSQLLSVAAAMSHKPSAVKKDEPPMPGAVKQGFDVIAVGSILARDLCAPAGQVLVVEGTALSERLINRLKELHGMGVCAAEAWVME